MKVYISRTSINCNTLPCVGAVAVFHRVWDERTFKTPEEHDSRFPNDPWLSRGSEHGVNSVGIYRRMAQIECLWVIEVPSIEALVEWNGRIIVDRVDDLTKREDPSIEFVVEIYDDYRE